MVGKVTIRPSVPGDVEHAVPLIYSSGPAAFDYVFKTKAHSALDYLGFAFQRPGGEFSYENHHSVLSDDKVIGVGAIFTGEEMLGFTLSEAKKIMQFYKFLGFQIMKRGLRIERLIAPPRKSEATLGHLAIHETMQGKGFGTLLIESLMASAKIKKHERFVLDVSLKNSMAQKLYEKLGFEVSKKCVSTLKNKYAAVEDHFRMERKILSKDQIK